MNTPYIYPGSKKHRNLYSKTINYADSDKNLKNLYRKKYKPSSNIVDIAKQFEKNNSIVFTQRKAKKKSKELLDVVQSGLKKETSLIKGAKTERLRQLEKRGLEINALEQQDNKFKIIRETIKYGTAYWLLRKGLGSLEPENER